MSVYFAQIGHDGPIKIGSSQNVARRLRNLQVGMPWKLRLLLSLDTVYVHEVYLHFSAARMCGEWFYPTKSLLRFIADQHPLTDCNPSSWVKARRRAGTNLTFLRRVEDICELARVEAPKATPRDERAAS